MFQTTKERCCRYWHNTVRPVRHHSRAVHKWTLYNARLSYAFLCKYVVSSWWTGMSAETFFVNYWIHYLSWTSASAHVCVCVFFICAFRNIKGILVSTHTRLHFALSVSRYSSVCIRATSCITQCGGRSLSRLHHFSLFSFVNFHLPSFIMVGLYFRKTVSYNWLTVGYIMVKL